MGYMACPLCCGRSFSNRKSLQYHLLSSQSSIACPECHQRFDTIAHLADHLELDTCEQEAVVISITSEHVDKDGADPGKSRGASDVETAGPTVFKEEIVACSTEDDEDTSYLSVSHDSDAILRWEGRSEDRESADATEHYCNSCDRRVYGVLAHINKYHPLETIILQNAETSDTEAVETETVEAGEGEEEENEVVEEDGVDVSDTGGVKGSKPPEVYGTLDESNMVDERTGIPYVRRIVHIEKFWERGEGTRDHEGKGDLLQRLLGVADDAEISYADGDDITPPVFLCKVCGTESEDPAHECPPFISPPPPPRPTPSSSTLCEVCGLACKSTRGLRSHILAAHGPNRDKGGPPESPVCDICDTKFTTLGGLKVHRRMHRPDNVQRVAEMNNKVEYRCDLCNMVCYSERTLGIHSRVHLTGAQAAGFVPAPSASEGPDVARELDLLSCKLCEQTFSSNEELKTHWRAHFPASAEGVAAEETVGSTEGVGEVTEDEGRFAQHFGCGVCNKHFATEEGLKFHATTHRTEVELECLTCKTKFTDPNELRQHRKTHAGADKPYPCGFCGRRFSRPHEKVKHERIHTGEKPYACGTCGMRFRVGYCLKMHERIHTGVRPYACEHCGKTFRARSGYKQHVRLHSDVRAFPCPHCPKSFKTVVQLAGHKKSHTKPYSCTECVRRFATVYAVRIHLATHAKSALAHRCRVCGASYGRDYALKDHLKTHHPSSTAREVEEAEGSEGSDNS